MEDNNIKWNYCDAMESIKGDAEEKEKAISLYNADTSSAKISSVKRGMPKIAVVALAFVCVLALSGGVVWAMNSAAIKDFFFPNSEEEFKQVYTEVGKEYDLGSHKIIFEGAAYEEAVQQGYLNFSVWDKEGNPFDIQESIIKYGTKSERLSAPLLTARFIHADKIRIGNDECYIVSIYNNGMFTFPEENNLFLKISRLDHDKDGEDLYKDKDFLFLILNKDQWKNFNEDLKALNEKELCTFTYDKETDKVIANFDENALLPEVMEVVNKYDPCHIESVNYPAQVITIGNVKITAGRTDMLLDYNVDNCDLGDFIIRRADGTELKLIKQENYYLKGDGSGEKWHSITWQVEDAKQYNTGIGGQDGKTGNAKYGFNYGFILGADEKVTIETNGQIYE